MGGTGIIYLILEYFCPYNFNLLISSIFVSIVSSITFPLSYEYTHMVRMGLLLSLCISKNTSL